MLGSHFRPSEPVVTDCYECALLAFCLPTRSRQAGPDIVVAGLFMKRCLNELRAIWLLLNLGYTSEAAAVAAAIFEAALLVTCVAGDKSLAEKCLASRSTQMPGPKELCKIYARGGRDPGRLREGLGEPVCSLSMALQDQASDIPFCYARRECRKGPLATRRIHGHGGSGRPTQDLGLKLTILAVSLGRVTAAIEGARLGRA